VANEVGVVMNKDKAVQVVAELMDVLHRHGVYVDTPYAFENFFQDWRASALISQILTGDGTLRDGDPEEYVKKPIAERIARYSRIPKERV
jgi:hypothetical protein